MDNHSMCKEFNPSLADYEVQTIAKLGGTLTNISNWMATIHLRLYGDIIEYVLFGSHKQLTKFNSGILTVNSKSYRD